MMISKLIRYTLPAVELLAELAEDGPRFARPVGQILRKLPTIYDEVSDIDINATDAEIDEMARQIAADVDIRARVKGVDVVGEAAEQRIISGFGMVFRDLRKARAA